MRNVLIFKDIRGHRWICGHTLLFLFGIVETGKKFFWDYDELCNRF